MCTCGGTEYILQTDLHKDNIIINWIADIELLKCVLKFSKFTRGSHSSASSGTPV